MFDVDVAVRGHDKGVYISLCVWVMNPVPHTYRYVIKKDRVYFVAMARRYNKIFIHYKNHNKTLMDNTYLVILYKKYPINIKEKRRVLIDNKSTRNPSRVGGKTSSVHSTEPPQKTVASGRNHSPLSLGIIRILLLGYYRSKMFDKERLEFMLFYFFIHHIFQFMNLYLYVGMVRTVTRMG